MDTLAILRDDIRTALVILARQGQEDSPLAAFLRAALERSYGESRT